jgi:carboxylesterase
VKRDARRARWWIGLAAAVLIVWLGGDFVYSRIIAHRVERWECTIHRDPDGVRSGCREYTLGQGETALLLVHGFNDSPAIFARLARRLADDGFTCRAMRLPGFAMPVEEYARTGRSQWREALAGELASLSADHERVGIVAHSLGGAISIDYLLDHPSDAAGAVLLAPLVAVSESRSPLLPPRAWHAIGSRVLLFSRVVETPFPLNARSPQAGAYDRNTRFTPREIFTELYALLDGIEGRDAEFRVPLMTALGRHDEVIDPDAAERFHRDSASPVKVRLDLEDAGHMLPLDNGWERLADEIALFFRSLPGESEGAAAVTGPAAVVD